MRRVDAHELLVAIEIAKPKVRRLPRVQPPHRAAAYLVAAQRGRVPRPHNAVVAAAGLNKLLQNGPILFFLEAYIPNELLPIQILDVEAVAHAWSCS